MPHYKNGAPATAGDLVIHAPSYPNAVQTLGILVNIQAGTGSCNASLIPVARKFSSWIPTSSPYQDCVSIGDCAAAKEDLVPVAVATEIPAPSAP